MNIRPGGIYRLPNLARVIARESPQGGFDLFTTQELTWQIRSAAYRLQPDGHITYDGKPTPWYGDDLLDMGTTVPTDASLR